MFPGQVVGGAEEDGVSGRVKARLEDAQCPPGHRGSDNSLHICP